MGRETPMKQVLKYQLSKTTMLADGSHPLSLPFGSKVVLVGEQSGVCTLWVEQPKNSILRGLQVRRFVAHGTGRDIEDHEVYVGTYFTGPFVWHIYELNPRESHLGPNE